MSLKKYTYLVNALHSTVLGWGASRSKTGREYWDELDWGINEWQDGGTHQFNLCGGQYLHVTVKYNPELDGPDQKHLRSYRVRCKHYIGSKWRGGVVADVQVKNTLGYWFWRVWVEN